MGDKSLNHRQEWSHRDAIACAVAFSRVRDNLSASDRERERGERERRGGNARVSDVYLVRYMCGEKIKKKRNVVIAWLIGLISASTLENSASSLEVTRFPTV